MSDNVKNTVGSVLNWILKTATALGAFFLYQVYGEIKANTATLETMKQQGLVRETEVRYELRDHDKRLTTVEQWKERMSTPTPSRTR